MDCYEFDQEAGRSFKTPAFFSPQLPSSSDQETPIVVVGVDEAGRGPLAGPVVVAAVILKPAPFIYGLGDSKTIPSERREALYGEIMENALSVSVSVIEPDVIDKINIFQATMKGMREAISGLTWRPHLVLVDGNQVPQSGLPERAIIKGDGKSAAIMAASLVAKVTRDFIMVELEEQFPGYGFEGHKGYGSASHIEAIKKLGPCPVHRKSFEPVKSLLQTVPSLL